MIIKTINLILHRTLLLLQQLHLDIVDILKLGLSCLIQLLLLNIAVNCSATLLNISWMAVEFPTNMTAIFKPFGGISQLDDLMLLGIHQTKYYEFLFWTLSICSSTSLVDILPLKMADAVKIFRVWDQQHTSCFQHRTFVG